MPSALRSASWAAPISSIALRRLAISVSRTVNTFSSSATASARAVSAAACASDWALDCWAMAIERSCSAVSTVRRRSISGRLDLALLADALGLQHAVALQAGALDLLAGRDLGALGQLLLLGPLARQLGPLAGAGDFDLRSWLRRALSASRSMSSESFSVSRFLLRIWIIVSCSMSLRIFLRRSICSVSRVRPSASKALDGLKNSMAVWSSWVSEADFQLQPVLQQVRGHGAAHPADIFAALLVQLLHGHLGGHRAQRVDELALEQLLQRVGLGGALAERLGRAGDRLGHGLDAHVELGDDVDPHAVARDQRLVAAARDLEPERVHVDRDDVVDDRQHEGAAVHHHLLPAHAGAHEGALLAGAEIEPMEQQTTMAATIATTTRPRMNPPKSAPVISASPTLAASPPFL